jgi:hypothetical protein
MLEEKRARVAMIAPKLLPDEEFLWDVGAIWRENPYLVSRKDAEGFLILTTRRVAYGNFRMGLILDIGLEHFANVEVTKPKRTMAHLSVTLDDGKQMRFYTGKKSAYMLTEVITEYIAAAGT